MKKFLFTLAALLAVGMSASANNAVLTLSQNEVSLNPGERVTIKICLQELEGVVGGTQLKYEMKDANGVNIPRSGNVYLNVASGGKWLTPLGMSADVPENNLSMTTPADGVYYAMGVNISYNIYWSLEDFTWQDPEDPDADPEIIWEGSAVELPQDVYSFEIRTRAAWDEEYAILEINPNDSKLVYYDNEIIPLDPEAFKVVIKNASYVVEDKDLTGEIVIGEVDENGNIPVSYNGPEDVTLTVTVDGEPVEIVDGMINLGSYGDHTVVVTVTADGYKPESRTGIYTWNEPVVEPKDLEGEIVIGDPTEEGKVEITYTGEEEVTVTVTVNGEPVEVVDGFITVGEGESAIVVTVTAEGYNDLTGEKTVTWTEPVVEPKDLEGEIVIGDPTEEGKVEITYTGEEEVTVTVTVNGEPVEVVDGFITVGEGESAIVVTVTAEGYNDLTGEKTVTWTAPEEPVVTPTPEIVVTETEDGIVIDVIGEGEIHVYVNGEEVEIPCTITKGEEETTYVITATAQVEGQEISATASTTVVVPAQEVIPEDPHDVGFWLVTIDKDGNEIWDKMETGADQDGYQTNVALTYTVYGTFHYADGEARPNVDFWVVIDGEKYGPSVDDAEPVLGQANENPIYVNENNWVIPVGYKYVIGVVKDTDGDQWYLQISQGGFVEVDELFAGKTVANVRYFNMAGQEMNEINGTTIVVTTFTDGTTNAVKVIK